MTTKNISIIVIYLALLGIIIWQQMAYNELENQYHEDKILFDANYGEVVRLKDDLGAYADSMRLLRRDMEKLKDSLVSK